MLKNYFKITWRNLIRNKTFSFIKIAGLSIGLCVCMLILLYTKDEISYDRFHANGQHIYRIVQAMQTGKDAPQKMAITAAPLGDAFKKDIPEVQQSVRIISDAITVKRDNEVFNENPLFADDNFFSVFTFPLKGDPATALKDIRSIILTEASAQKYFGTTDVIGKTLQLKFHKEFENFKVSGIAEKAPQNSTIKFDMILPLEYYLQHNQMEKWVGGALNTFLLLSPGANTGTVEKKMQVLFDKHTKTQIEEAEKEMGISISIFLGLQAFTAIHLDTELGPINGLTDGSSAAYSYILTAIAIFILLIACINFINLSIGQSLKRSKEIGVRKVVGETRKQLIVQFLIESLVVSFIAFIIAFVLTYAVLPWFNELANKKLSLSYLSDIKLYIGWFLLLMITSFLSGIYPSLVLSGLQPANVLYNRQKLMGKNYLAKGLVVLQFSLAIFLIIGTMVVNKQLNFLFHTDLGFDSKNLVRINLPRSETSDQLPALFKNELSNQSGILSISTRNGGRSTSAVKADGKQIEIDYNKIDNNYFHTFKIPILSGRNFSPGYSSDSLQSVIVNESFATEAGWKTEEAVGKSIQFVEDGRRTVSIVGVIKNYHFASLKEKIKPQLFSMDPSMTYGQLWIKISPENIPRTLAVLKTTHAALIPFYPYDYQFMDDGNVYKYEVETRWKQIISIASILFIFISCIGLLGLVILSIEQRTKEIGIRKVLGAAVSRILMLISKDFILLIVIAFVITAPVAYYAVRKWLQDFAYRVDINWWTFVAAGLLALFIALATVSFLAIKAAITNPVKSLRTE